MFCVQKKINNIVNEDSNASFLLVIGYRYGRAKCECNLQLTESEIAFAFANDWKKKDATFDGVVAEKDEIPPESDISFQ